MNRQGLRPHQKILLLSGAVVLLSWITPGLSLLMLPFRYLNTHIHELAHAMAALASGGSVDHIQVFRDGSGITLAYGGSLFLIASAGYVGAAALGASVVAMSGSDKGARSACWIVAVLIALSMILWVRGDAAGIGWGIAWIVALALAAITLEGAVLHFVGQLVGMFLCLSSAQSVFALTAISATGMHHSDAAILGSATGIPAILWALIWLMLSFALVTAAIRGAWKAEAKSSKSYGL